MARKTKIKVGTDWTSCPCCKSGYLTTDPHHIACPIGMSTALCQFCGVAYGRPHDHGCPHSTGLFPILHREVWAHLECGGCNTLFQLGECFVAGKTSIICLGCGWLEAGVGC